MITFRGVVVPLLTPLKGDGELDRPAAARYVEYLLTNGVDGLFALSSTGEFCALPWRVQLETVEAIVEQTAGRAPVCAGISTQCLSDCINRSRDLASLGVDAVVALPPFYFRTSQEEMLEFFSRIADASPVPLLLYNMPFRTQHVIEPDTVLALRDHGNIIGLKDSVNDLDRTLHLARSLRGETRFAYLHGNELLTIEAATAGAHGCVPSLANLAPAFMVDAWNRAASGNLAAREADQEKIKTLMSAFSLFEERPQQSTTLRLMALKAVLSELGVMSSCMAQLAPPVAPEWQAKARAFAVDHGLVAYVSG